MRVYAEKGMKCASCMATSRPRRPYFSLANTTMDRPSGVSSARLESCAASASSPSVTPRTGEELHGLAISQRNGSGFIEQQRVYVAGRLHGLSAHGQHVVLHHAIHAGDPDCGKQSADRGGDQANQQCNQDRHRRHRDRLQQSATL